MNLQRFLWSVALSISAMSTALGQMIEEEESESIAANEPPANSAAVERSPQAVRLIVELTNEFRRSEKLEAVAVNQQLDKAAQYFAEYMAQTDKYGHTADGNRPTGRAARFGYEYCLVSENIAYQYSSAGFDSKDLASRIVEGWKQSPGHRKNMLDADVTEIGVAVAKSPSTGYWYAVQMFGRPASQAIEFAIANHSTANVSYSIDERTFELPPRYSRTHTRCRESQINIETSREAGPDKSLTPADGQRFVIEGEGADLRIRRE